MTNRSEAQTAALTWTVRHNGPGTTRYYEATHEATGTAFTAYQVGKSNWFLTGARDGETVIETADTTLKGVKFLAATFAASAAAADEDAPAARPALVWTSRKEWGARGLTHRAKATVGAVNYSVAVDSPQPGEWAVRAWKDGDFAHYRVFRTKTEAQAEAETWFAGAAPAEAARYGCGCPSPVHRMSCGLGARPAVINRKDA